jgi:hypothetical protein
MASGELEGKDSDKQDKTWCVFEIRLNILTKSASPGPYL